MDKKINQRPSGGLYSRKKEQGRLLNLRPCLKKEVYMLISEPITDRSRAKSSTFLSAILRRPL